jgi:hypothetical protein
VALALCCQKRDALWTLIRPSQPSTPTSRRCAWSIGAPWSTSAPAPSAAATTAATASTAGLRAFLQSHPAPGQIVWTAPRKNQLHDQRGLEDQALLPGIPQGASLAEFEALPPNLDALVREGRALFADDAETLDERIVTTERELTDDGGARWAVEVPTFADARLAALVESRREAEMVQCALRGRPLDHPEAQITLLFGLPLPGLEPTVIWEEAPTPTSNGGRQATAILKLIAAAQTLLASGQTRLTAIELAQTAQVSEVTARGHWNEVATRLGLRQEEEQAPAHGRYRTYRRRVLVQANGERAAARTGTDQADNEDSLTCLISTDPLAEMLCIDACDGQDPPSTAPLGSISEPDIGATDPARRPRTRFIRPRVLDAIDLESARSARCCLAPGIGRLILRMNN